MAIRPMSSPAQKGQPSQQGAEKTERFLTLLIEGAAQQMPEVDATAYKSFRQRTTELSCQIPDHLPDDDKLALIRNVLREFEIYHSVAAAELKDRQTEWRALTGRLLRELVASLGIDGSSLAALPLIQRAGQLSRGAEIQAFCGELDDFLHIGGRAVADSDVPLRAADRSTENDNAAGLMGGGAAVEKLAKIMESGGRGFVALFRLSCLEVISERFGMEAVQDCLMAVSSFLTNSLHSGDAVYHWSDSSLLAILQARVNEHVLAVELKRISSNNRDITIQINGRTVMLRVPLEFDITPISRFRSADELYKLSLLRAATV